MALKKYLLFAFLLENIAAQTFLLRGASDVFFYTFLAIGLILMIMGNFFEKRKLRKFGWMYALMVLYVAYEFLIGTDYINEKTLLYMGAKIVTFGIIIISLDTDENFYRTTAVKWLVLAMAFFILHGLLTGNVTNTGFGRLRVGYTNENTVGSMGALIVGMLLFIRKGKILSLFDYGIIILGFYAVLAGASRAGFLMLALLILFRYGLNFKTIAIGIILLILGLYVLPALDINTVGISRMVDTYNGVEGTNREVERQAADWMIAQKPLTGWGYGAENQGFARVLTIMPSHNGYLEIIKQMGYPCAIIYFIIISITVIKGFFTQLKQHEGVGLFMALTLMILVSAMFEALFIGVHEYDTNLFFVSLALVSARTYKLNRQ